MLFRWGAAGSAAGARAARPLSRSSGAAPFYAIGSDVDINGDVVFRGPAGARGLNLVILGEGENLWLDLQVDPNIHTTCLILSF